jgi:hypothetical protein
VIGHMMSCFQSRRLSSRSSVRLSRCTLIVALIAFSTTRAPRGRYAVAYKDHLQLVRLRRRATRFLIRNCLSAVAFGSKKQTLGKVRLMSAFPPKADIGTQSRNVRFVAEADIGLICEYPRATDYA